MILINRLRWTTGVAALILTVWTPAEARTKKGEKLVEEGRKLEAKKDWDAALEKYDAALMTDPADPMYQILTRRVRFQAAQMHVDRGQKLREAGQLKEALDAFMKAYAIDPASGIAAQEVRRTSQMIEREKKKAEGGAEGTQEERSRTPAEEARREMEKNAESLMPLPQLKPVTATLPPLKMNNQPVRVLFETVGKLAGISVIFDSEYSAQGRNFNIDLTSTTLEEALDQVATLTKSYWKPLSANAIFVTQDNPQKRRDYEDNVVKVFYLTNLTKPQDLQEWLTAVRTISDIRRIFPVNALNAIVVRGTPDQVALAEKLIVDMDKPRAEVVVDVVVMEASRSKSRSLAATIANGSTAGLNIPITFDPRNAVTRSSNGDNADNGDDTSSGTIRLGQITRLNENDWTTTLPGAFIQALMSDRSTRVLQSPQVRAIDGEKAQLRVGDRYPYATGSFQPGVGVGGGGVSPLVSTQFQFAEVGVNLDLSPRVHGAEEVTLHVEMEVSSVRDTINVGGLSQPVIGQRRTIVDIRLRDGEATIIGGLYNTQDTKAVSGVPGLGNIPVIRRLFSSESVDRNHSELMIALVPHIVRSPDIGPSNTRAIAAGNDQQVKLLYAPRVAPAPAGTAAPGAPAPATPAAPGAEAPKPAEPPKTEAPKAEAPKAETRLLLVPSAVETQLGRPVQVSVQAENVNNIFSAMLRMKFDPKLVRVTDVKVGGFLGGDGQRVTFSENTLNDTGEAIIALNRFPGAGGISGTGTILTFTLQPQAAGSAVVTFSELTLRNAQLQPITVATPSMTVAIK
ncbi:MAG: cohesin domain-containing protein [Bryobacteraceae bacterium]|nr:cohesin domain-containing protein [Bryobacteraceae bacterium]